MPKLQKRTEQELKDAKKMKRKIQKDKKEQKEMKKEKKGLRVINQSEEDIEIQDTQQQEEEQREQRYEEFENKTTSLDQKLNDIIESGGQEDIQISENDEQVVPDEAPAVEPSQAPTTPSSKLQRFVTWFKKHGGVTNIEIRDEVDCRGLFTKSACKQDDLLVQVPNQLILSLKRIGSLEYKPGVLYKSIFAQHLELFNANFAEPASWMDLQIVFFLIAEKEKGESSEWFPFIDSLPTEYDNFATSKEYDIPSLCKLVQGGADEKLVQFVNKRQKNIQRLFSKFYAECKENLPSLNIAIFNWAWLTVQTRGFGDDFLPFQLSLMPMLDMLNHSNQRSLIQFKLQQSENSEKLTKANFQERWKLNDRSIGFSILARSNLEAGTEIFDEYDKQPNAQLLDMHGFCIQNNPNELFELKLTCADAVHAKNFGRWKVNLELSSDSLHIDFIKFIQAIPGTTNPKQVIQKYMGILQDKQRTYPTTKEQDFSFFESEEENSLTKFGILYRFCQKNIITNQVRLCKDLMTNGKLPGVKSKALKKFINEYQVFTKKD